MAEEGDCKPLLPLLTVPLIERTIAAANQAGLTEFCVVTGHNRRRVEMFLSELSLRRNLTITAVANEDWEKGNGTSVYKARELLDEPFVLLMADHVFDEVILTRLVREPLQDGELILAADYNVDGNRFVDADDVTRVLAENGRIIEIGKGLEDYNAYDTGIFLCSAAIFPALEAAMSGGDFSLSGGVRRLAAQGRARTIDVRGCFWIDVDTPNDLKKAQKLLYTGLAKPLDGFISRTINRPLSTRIFTPLLLRISHRITANQVSVLSFVVALSAGVCFFFQHAVIGGIALQLASILDGSDGEIARLKKLQSNFGNFLDAVLDRYADSFVLFGMFYYSWTAPANAALLGRYLDPLILGTSMLAICGNLMVSYTSAKSITDFGYRYRGKWIAAGRGRDLRLFLLFVGAVLAWVHPLSVLVAMFCVAVSTNAVVLRRIAISRRHARSREPLLDGPPKAIIFDFDGTIADTMPFLTELAVSLITESYGGSREEAHRKYLETTGMDFASQIEQGFPGHSKNREVITTFEARKRDGVLSHPLFPEVIPTLKYFKDRNIRRFVCSSTTPAIISEYIRRHKIGNWLDDCLGYEPGFSKDKQIESILKQHALEPDEVIFVGDSLRDYDFVKDRNIRFIGVHGLFDEEAFRARRLTSIADLSALTRMWDRSDDLLRFVEQVNKPG